MFINKITFVQKLPSFLYKDLEKEHQFIMSLFPDGLQKVSPRGENSILFRDDLDPLGRKTYLIQSPLVPSVENIKSDLKNNLTLQTKDISQIYSDILGREKFSYKIRVNPVKSINIKLPDGKTKTRRQPIRTPEEIKVWWETQSLHHGFMIDTDKTIYIPETIRKLRTTSINTVSINGIAAINDIQKLRDSIIHGIGREKSYGYGLLLLGRSD